MAYIAQARPRFQAHARDYYGITVNEGPFGISSRPALVGAKFAEAHGLGHDYHLAVLSAYFMQAQDISDLNVLADIAEQVGLNPADFRAALNDPAAIAAVEADVDQAHQLGLNGVPALVFQQKYLVSGAQPYETLVKVVEQLLGQN